MEKCRSCGHGVGFHNHAGCYLAIDLGGSMSGCPCSVAHVPAAQEHEQERRSGVNIGVVIKGENKNAPHLSHADIMHIKTRKIDPDGVVRSHPRWETKDY